MARLWGRRDLCLALYTRGDLWRRLPHYFASSLTWLLRDRATCASASPHTLGLPGLSLRIQKMPGYVPVHRFTNEPPAGGPAVTMVTILASQMRLCIEAVRQLSARDGENGCLVPN